MAETRKWDGTTYGSQRMHRWLIAMLKAVDVRLLYAFASVFVVPPCLLRPGFRPMYRYFRQRMGCRPWQAFRRTYANHCIFAQAVIDKFAMYAGKTFDIEVEGFEHFQRLSRQPGGFVQFSSHVGNYEIAGYSLSSKDKPMNVLLFGGEKSTVMEKRDKMLARSNIHMFSVREDMGHLFEINRALTDGEIVSIPADRIWGSAKQLTKTFLGAEAAFPEGPFHVAVLHQTDVLTVHVMKTAPKRYRIYVTPLTYDRQAPRRQQMEQLADAYVAELERMVRQYPTQWYNYYDFWT